VADCRPIECVGPSEVEMNLSEFNVGNETLIGGSFECVDVNNYTCRQRVDTLVNWATIISMRDIIWYSSLAMGIPGSILSAIVWVRHHVAHDSSPAVYLAALATANLTYLLSRFLCLYLTLSDAAGGWIWQGANYLAGTAGLLEPLLLLGYSVERLIAILRPLLVCRTRCIDQAIVQT